MMMNKQKTEKKSFKERIMKVLFIVLIGFMIFGAMRSCVKVKASTDSLQLGTYIFDDNITIQVLNNISTHFQDLEIVSDSGVWFTSNGTEFTKMKFLYEPYSGVSGGYFSLRYINSSTSTSIVVFESSYSNGNGGYSWVSEDYRKFEVTNMYNLRTFFYGSQTNDIQYFYEIISVFVSDSYYTGYDDGYNKGYQEALNYYLSLPDYHDGFQDGYDSAYDYYNDNPTELESVQQIIDYNISIAYDEGFEDGMDDNNPYTFKSLLFAVFDVPVQVITGLFNWDFLGYNLADFVFTLFTMAIIIMIVRRLV